MQECHQLVKPISWLIGSWLSKKAHGEYPTMKSFDYKELVEITHPAPHQPVLHLKYNFAKKTLGFKFLKIEIIFF